MECFESLVAAINNAIWGAPLIVAILAIGIYFSFNLGILRPSRLKLSVKYALEEGDGHGEISIFASLCAALSGTIGTGNITGIAVAIASGGPGALFWLWLSSIFSFAIKYAEGLLAIKYRSIESNGTISGGPMYYIENGLQNKRLAKILAKIFSIGGMLVALIGIGTLAQSNSISIALGSWGIPTIPAAFAIVVAVAAVVLGGLRRIAAVSEKIVPIMTIFYVGAAVVALIINYSAIPNAFRLIFTGAFSPESILGGGLGATVAQVASIGVRRGIFSHESGLGSSAIAGATAKVDSSVKQGFASILGAALSVIICTMTGIVLIVAASQTGLFTSAPILEGARLTSYSFGCCLGNFALGKYAVEISMALFAFTTIIAWNYYGKKCARYVFGDKAIAPYNFLFLFFVAIGPFFRVNAIFDLADIAIGIMAIANLIGLVMLRKVAIAETKAFFRGGK
ncbi:MAG: amino acid carrier protein [Holosporaceae bacterium]|jgi:AGCS family alanine or glycine:cation symporter|nr:amino acid carrier protein [Holosporaceae bacterium]